MSFLRPSGRDPEALRELRFEVGYTKWAEGSVLCSFGDTKVLCNASVEDRVPGWMRGRNPGQGWVTGEYSMLPRATDRRTQREARQGKVGGRTHEISRLLGRSLRAAVNLKKLGERTITLDCDVLQADGGTRTASISGAWLALAIALDKLVKDSKVSRKAMLRQIAAVSLGVKEGSLLLDLDYAEDQQIDTDLNLVMTEAGEVIEVQGTAEGAPLKREELDGLIALGQQGIQQIMAAQMRALKEAILSSGSAG